MSFSPYLSQAQYFADELLDLLDADDRQRAGDLFDADGYALVRSMTPQEQKAVADFLEATPSRRAPRFARLTGQDRLIFWLRARYMALSAVEALLIAQDAEILARGGYRSACRAIAEAIHPYPQLVHKADLMDKRLHQPSA